jgi:hypothetical protein
MSSGRVQLGVSGALLAAAALVAVEAGCQPAADPPQARSSTTATSVPTGPIAVVASGDTAGWIVPCGCTANQSGGLSRRATYVKDLRKTHQVLLVDVGGAPAGTSPYQQLRFEAILRGERKMGVMAHNVGEGEAALGLAAVRELAARSGVPFVSANVQNEDGSAVVSRSVVANVGGRRMLISGVLSPALTPEGVTVTDPKTALLSVLDDQQGAFDHFIVLAWLPEAELETLARELPEADAVLGGPTGQAIPPRSAGPTLLAAATNKGKFLVELVQADPRAAWSGRIVEAAATLANDPEQDANLVSFRSELEKRDFNALESGLVPPLPADSPPGFRLAGSAACQDCHDEDCQSWESSRHAHAWETLLEKASFADPFCQQCHTDGYGMPGGFFSIAQGGDRRNVGCETCHGPSQAHLEDSKIPPPFLASDQCVRCHDHENSPTFNYDSYWSEIVHGLRSSGEP